jgi:hypothetical protein
MSKRFRLICLTVLLVPVFACERVPETSPTMVTQWMNMLFGVVRAERASPNVGSRLFAYGAIALYAGFSQTDSTLPQIVGQFNELDALPRAEAGKKYDPELVALSSERVVLDSLLDESLPTIRAAVAHLSDSVETARAKVVSSAIGVNSKALGRATGLAIVAWAHGDGFDSTRGRPYVAPVGDGLWVNDDPATLYSAQSISGASQLVVPTNPANQLRSGGTDTRSLILDRPKPPSVKKLAAANMAGVTEPYWGYNRPFALKGWNDCPAPLPPAYSKSAGTPLYEEARQVMEIGKKLTPDQKEIALYWADNPGETATPAGHWLSIASQMIEERNLSAPQAAWMMAVTGTALADAFISAWAYKFRLNLIRPRTFIRQTMDPTWEPAIPTPPFPEYLSGHSTVSSAAAGTLTALLGATPFNDSTNVSIGHPARRFESFKAAAEEAGLSRIYGGIHFPSGNVEGRRLGECVASRIARRLRVVPIAGDARLPKAN